MPVFPTQTSWSIAQVYTDSKFLIRISSFFKLLIESAIAIETAKGNPSGIATIIITMAIMAIFTKSINVLLSVKLWSDVRTAPSKKTA